MKEKKNITRSNGGILFLNSTQESFSVHEGISYFQDGKNTNLLSTYKSPSPAATQRSRTLAVRIFRKCNDFLKRFFRIFKKIRINVYLFRYRERI